MLQKIPAIPQHGNGPSSPEVKIMRLRVDLEKAIAAEDFEKAAILRDDIGRIKKLEMGSYDEGGSA